MKTPVLFLSHGAPSLALEPGETGAAWRQIAAQLITPSAILVVSAHWETRIPFVSAAVRPETIHDFSGFPDALYQLHYPAPGAPQLADDVAHALQQSGMAVRQDAGRGLDHGAWIPLSLMYPQANIPVAQLSIQAEQDTKWHLALGRALRPLREQGVLIIASGSITHNLPAIFRHPPGSPAPEWVTAFCDWMVETIAQGDLATLADYRARAPHAVQNHPTDEHLLPLFVALGATEDISQSQHLNPVMTFGMLAMDAWLFEG